MHGLQPLTPHDGVQYYLDERKSEVTQSTFYEHKTRLNRFLEWCDQEDIDNLNNLTSRLCRDYMNYRQERVAPSTLENEMRTFRLAVKTWEQIQGVGEGLSKNVKVPTAKKSEKVSELKIEGEQAEAIMEYLGKYEYATLRHMVFALIWHTGCRISGLRALDLKDWKPDKYRKPVLSFEHRKATGTPLKKEGNGERDVAVTDEIATLIEDYIDGPRLDVTDDYDRRPLLTTENGRPFKTTVQRNIYRVTQPCYIGWECPYGENPATCEWTDYNQSSKCPGSVSPHGIRKTNVTHFKNLGFEYEEISGRVDASVEVLVDHYDHPSTAEERERQFDMMDRMERGSD